MIGWCDWTSWICWDRPFDSFGDFNLAMEIHRNPLFIDVSGRFFEEMSRFFVAMSSISHLLAGGRPDCSWEHFAARSLPASMAKLAKLAQRQTIISSQSQGLNHQILDGLREQMAGTNQAFAILNISFHSQFSNSDEYHGVFCKFYPSSSIFHPFLPIACISSSRCWIQPQRPRSDVSRVRERPSGPWTST